MNATPTAIIDVLSAESFAEEHLPGAVNICVYETAFLDKVRDQFPDTGTHLTVYGYCDETREAGVAVSRLMAAGYRHVEALPGGLEGWKSGGGEVEQNIEPTTPETMRYEVDPVASLIQWTGCNLFNFHHGTMRLAGGSLVVNDRKLTKANFAIDMASLACTDLTDTMLNEMLIRHLRSNDFFAVDEYPLAEFEMTSVEPIEATPGLPNYRIRGDFTLRGAISPIELNAVVAQKDDGGYVAQAVLDLDRTLWGAVYGSGKFFSRLGQHVVNDLVHLHLKIVTFPGRGDAE